MSTSREYVALSHITFQVKTFEVLAYLQYNSMDSAQYTIRPRLVPYNYLPVAPY